MTIAQSKKPIQSATRRNLTSRRTGHTWMPWLFLTPALILGMYFKFIPMLEGLRLSFYKVQPFLGNTYIGLANYIKVLGNERFQDALGHTILLGTVQSLGALFVGFLLALLLEGQTRTLFFLRTAIFLPVVTAIAVVGEIWRILYFPTSDGIMNVIFSWIGLGPFEFLNGTDSAIWSVAVVGIWSGAPYNMVIILAGLAGVDRQLYESADLDGASIWQRLRYITIPAIRPAITIVLTLAAIRSLRIFTEIYVLTGGGPAGSTEVWMTRVYSVGFSRNDIGLASAASILLLVVSILLTITVQYFGNRKARA